MELGIRGAAILLLGANPICLCALYDFYAALAIACAILMAVAVLYEGACVAALLLLPSWLLRLSTIRVDRNLPLRAVVLVCLQSLQVWCSMASVVHCTFPVFWGCGRTIMRRLASRSVLPMLCCYAMWYCWFTGEHYVNAFLSGVVLAMILTGADCTGLYGTIRDYTGLYGAIWHYTGLYGTIWDHTVLIYRSALCYRLW